MCCHFGLDFGVCVCVCVCVCVWFDFWYVCLGGGGGGGMCVFVCLCLCVVVVVVVVFPTDLIHGNKQGKPTLIFCAQIAKWEARSLRFHSLHNSRQPRRIVQVSHTAKLS